MKNKYLIVLVAALSLSLSSCENYLNRTPLDQNSDATNWTSESSLETDRKSVV